VSVAKPAAARRLLTNASAGAAQALVSGLVLFGLYRILLSRLGPEHVGAWSLLMAWLSLARITDLGLPGAIVRFAAPLFAAGDKAQGLRLVTRGVLASAAFTALSSALGALLLQRAAPAFLAHQPHDLRLVAQAALVTWLFCTTVALRAGLDSLQRVDLRHGTMILQNIAYLAAAFVLVKPGSIHSLLVSQAVSLSATAAFTLWLLWRELRARTQISAQCSSTQLRDLLRYGLGFQATTISALLLDPLAKQLLGHYADLASVTWYEMSSKVVTQVRAVVANAMEALVPHVAAKSATEQRSLDGEYARVFSINLALSSLGTGVLVVNAPLLGLLWVGRYEPTFLSFIAVLALAWWVNTLCIPAYFMAQGLGRQRWPVLNHIVMAVVVAALGVPLGARLGGVGVLWALVVAMLASTWVLLAGVHRALAQASGRPVRVRIPPSYALLALGLLLPGFWADASWSLMALLGLGLLGSVLVIALVWRANRVLIPRFTTIGRSRAPI
jgi:O-antigen/teichoic acid export membrane protein